MPRFLLHHTHLPPECAVVFAAWKGMRSPLRGNMALCSCHFGGHELWWELHATDEAAAIRLLPRFVAERSQVIRVDSVQIP